MHYIDSPIKFCCRYILGNDTPIYSSSQDFGKGEGGGGGGQTWFEAVKGSEIKMKNEIKMTSSNPSAGPGCCPASRA